MFAKVLYRRDPDFTGRFFPANPELYSYVGDIETPGSEESDCEFVFRKFNRVEDGDMEGMNIRSMSVGDAVLFENGSLYFCQGMGWSLCTGNSLAFWNLPKA